MKRQGHLTGYRLTVTTVGPVHIGTGRQLAKSEYCFDAGRKQVLLPDQTRLFDWILARGAEDRYEEFVLSGGSNLQSFLSGEGITPEELEEMALCRVDPGDALTGDRPLQNLCLFRRDSRGRPYIPGSSLKGALRTLLLQEMLRQKSWNRPVDFESRFPGKFMEGTLLSQDERPSPLSSRMRGVLLSDSLPLANSDLVLCSREDLGTGGRVNAINQCRECLRPGTAVTFALTVDRRIWPEDFAALLTGAVAHSWAWYQEKYLSRFPDPPGLAELRQNAPVFFLGGGSGYFSKNIAYHALPWDLVVRRMAGSRKYSRRNRRDVEAGIFPHMLKCTTVGGRRVQIGACRLTIE